MFDSIIEREFMNRISDIDRSIKVWEFSDFSHVVHSPNFLS
jgi:hypothetical protein